MKDAIRHPGRDTTSSSASALADMAPGVLSSEEVERALKQGRSGSYIGEEQGYGSDARHARPTGSRDGASEEPSSDFDRPQGSSHAEVSGASAVTHVEGGSSNLSGIRAADTTMGSRRRQGNEQMWSSNEVPAQAFIPLVRRPCSLLLDYYNEALASLLKKDPLQSFAFCALRQGASDLEDVRNVYNLCKKINVRHAPDIFEMFFRNVLVARSNRSCSLRAQDSALTSTWYNAPWYYTYVQDIGATEALYDSSFLGLAEMIPYFKHMNFQNIFLVAHWESPMGDRGFDVASYEPREDLGGREGFDYFMLRASQAGLRIATDAVFSHTSTAHAWFQRAIRGEKKYMDYYIRCDGREKLGEVERDGLKVCQYREADGTFSEYPCKFPNINPFHSLYTYLCSNRMEWHSDFYPFQANLNLGNPDVLDELLKVVANELNRGVMGFRMNNVSHWIKEPGNTRNAILRGHALQAFFKAFIKHVAPKSIIFPGVLDDNESAAKYAGIQTTMAGHSCASEGDALFSCEMQAALRQVTFFRNARPFWDCVSRTPQLPTSAIWINMLDTNDEIDLRLYEPRVRARVQDYIMGHGGLIASTGIAGIGNFSDFMEHNPARIAVGIFLLYISPGAPLVYAGLEIGYSRSSMHMYQAAIRRRAALEPLGVCLLSTQAEDPRDLQRGPVPKYSIYYAATVYTPTLLMRALNHLRQARPSLRSRRIYEIKSSDQSVVVLVRGRRPIDDPLLCIANLDADSKDVLLNACELHNRLELGAVPYRSGSTLLLSDLLTSSTVFAYAEGGSYRMHITPYFCSISVFSALHDP